ncbi:MAG: hypothetical protein V4560_19130 [Bacteroidota bacterium]
MNTLPYVFFIADSHNTIYLLEFSVMESIYDELRSKLKCKTCPIHHKHPHVEFKDNRLELVCCCDDLKQSCYKEIIRLFKSNTQNLPDHVFKR